MRTLLIDDMRTMAVDKIVRTYDEGIEALKSQHWDFLYLDHDLGDKDDRKTGYGIVCWLENNPQHLPGNVSLVTANPVGRRNMQFVLSKFYKDHRNDYR